MYNHLKGFCVYTLTLLKKHFCVSMVIKRTVIKMTVIKRTRVFEYEGQGIFPFTCKELGDSLIQRGRSVTRKTPYC